MYMVWYYFQLTNFRTFCFCCCLICFSENSLISTNWYDFLYFGHHTMWWFIRFDVTLNIEIYSNDFDKLIVENLDSSLNLSNINLNFSILQIPDPSKTNIIITLINGNDFTGYFDSTTWQIGFTGNVFIEGNDVKVTGVIPEPSVFLIYSLLIIFRLTLFYKK